MKGKPSKEHHTSKSKNKDKTKEKDAAQVKLQETDASETHEAAESHLRESGMAPDDDTRKALEAAEKRAAEYLESLQRLKAEFDNYRKRMEKEKERLSELHQSIVIEAILPTLDAFEAAFEKPAESGNGEQFREGIYLVYEGLLSALRKRGLERIDVLNKPFDPEVAEALTSVPSPNHAPNTVISEVSAGYMFKGRVLRPARVVVSAAPEAEGEGNVVTDERLAAEEKEK